MSIKKVDIVIVGAGIIGVAIANYLSKENPQYKIVLLDKQQPLSFTTSRSGENFREYWPQPYMNEFVGRSIELMRDLKQANKNSFNMKNTGYDFVSHKSNHSIFSTETNNEQIKIVEDSIEIKKEKPYLSADIARVEHILNAGSIDVNALGTLLLKGARDNKVEFIQQEVIGVNKTSVFEILLKDDRIITANKLILASGPFISEHCKQLNIELPIYNTRQCKFVFNDINNVIPRDMPFTIYADEQYLDWNAEEKSLIESDNDFKWLLDKFPAGLHIKPEGQNQVKMGWAYNKNTESPSWDPVFNENFANTVMKGAVRFIPNLSCYLDNIPTPITHFSGYYTQTKDNLPVIGELTEGLFIAGALSGYGTMSACSTAELLVNIIDKKPLPNYAKYFSPERFSDNKLMEEIGQYSSGQL